MKILISNGIDKLSQNIGKYFSQKHEIQYFEDPSKKESLKDFNSFGL